MIELKNIAPSGTVILDNAKRSNALSREMLDDLLQAFDDFHQEKSIRAVILTGAGPHFCAGADLHQWKETSDSEIPMHQWFEDSSKYQELLEKMLRFPKPIIAAVDGAAIGMGFGLVLACDLVVASQRARFSLPAPRLGLVSGLVAPLLSFRLGGSTAARMLLGDATLDVEQAMSLGLVHHVVEPEMIWARAHSWAQKIAESSPQALQLTKRVLNEMVGENLFTQLANGAAATASACTTESANEGLLAFVEKREPKFP